jgi:hypothetical protein
MMAKMKSVWGWEGKTLLDRFPEAHAHHPAGPDRQLRLGDLEIEVVDVGHGGKRPAAG